jgi:peroxiredoxin (alkyl hydroperoxide reductase subunit C)
MNANTMEAPRPGGLPRLNERAPQFEAVTTQGTIKLSDYEGSWLILFSHPADFTPVCTTEFAAFAEIATQLRERNVELLGLSIDSVFSHLAWMRSIRSSLGVTVPFPVIADLDRAVATAYGMIMPGESSTETSRCVFFIDPKSVVRAMIYYPLSLGRNMKEILRVVDALQMADANQVATPANWEPGQKVIVPAPRTMEDLEKRIEAGYECADWYLCYKSLNGAATAPEEALAEATV